MSPGKLTLLSNLEKFKAGIGAAGMAAMAIEALGPRLLGGVFSGFVGNIIPVVGAVLSAAVAAHFTEVSGKEARLGAEAAKEGTTINESGQ